MPDGGLPVAEGGRPGGGGGNHWLIIGAVAGVGTLLFLMFKGGGSSSGTTAAGTSINAALGSIQEQNLNLMGQLGSSTTAIQTQISGMSDQMTKQFTDLDAHLTDMNNQLSGELNDVNANQILIAQAQSVMQSAIAARQYADFTVIEAGPNDPRVKQWIDYSMQLVQKFNDIMATVKGTVGTTTTSTNGTS